MIARNRPSLLLILLLLLGPVLAACSDDGDSSTETSTTAPGTTAASDDGSTTSTGTEPLSIVVTNDDGYDSDGIDTVATALDELGDVEISVVAPLEPQSGQGGTFTEGAVETQEEQTASGIDAVAVDGYPADAVRVALEELELDPDLVVSGINSGQNLGPVVDVSGTVGAARAAVASGVPALALSSGIDDPDYAAAVPFMVDWITEHRAALVAGEAPVEVTSINVPSCNVGEVRGLEEVPVGTDGTDAVAEQDCTSDLEDPVDDVEAFNAGFATLTVLPDEPATPYQPG